MRLYTVRAATYFAHGQHPLHAGLHDYDFHYAGRYLLGAHDNDQRNALGIGVLELLLQLAGVGV